MTTLTLGQNVQAELKDGKLIITIDTTQELGSSRSGKSLMVATTGGNQKVTTPEGTISIGLNAYKPRRF